MQSDPAPPPHRLKQLKFCQHAAVIYLLIRLQCIFHSECCSGFCEVWEQPFVNLQSHAHEYSTSATYND